jgi:hypothetical protein
MTYYEKVQTMPNEWIEEQLNNDEITEYQLTCLTQEKNDRINMKIRLLHGKKET